MIATVARIVLAAFVALPALADLCVQQGTFESPSAAGNVVIDQRPCQPKIIIFSYGRTPDNATTDGTNEIGFSLATSPSAQVTVYGTDSDSTSANWATHDNTRMVNSAISTGTSPNRASLTAINSDGFTLNFTAVNTTYRQLIRWLYFGGSDITGANLVQYQYDGNSSMNLTGAGFAPDAIILLTAGLPNAPPYQSTNISYAQATGFATRVQGAQGAQSGWSNYSSAARTRAQTPDVTGSNGRVLWVAGDSSIQASAYVSSWDGDGVTLTFDTAPPSNWYFWVLYIKGPQFHLATFNNPASTGSQQVTGAPFPPSLVVVHSFCSSSSTGVVSGSHVSRGFGFGTSDQGLFWSGRLTGSATSDMAKYNTHLAGCYTPQGGAPAELVRGAFSRWVTDSGNGNGVEIYWTVTNTTQRQFIGLMIGPATPPAERTVSPLLISHRRFP